jgi:hypothetical protein
MAAHTAHRTDLGRESTREAPGGEIASNQAFSGLNAAEYDHRVPQPDSSPVHGELFVPV